MEEGEIKLAYSDIDIYIYRYRCTTPIQTREHRVVEVGKIDEIKLVYI